MEAGLGQLRLSPAEFWAMTPREFAAAMGGMFGQGELERPPDRGELDDMMMLFPDGL